MTSSKWAFFAYYYTVYQIGHSMSIHSLLKKAFHAHMCMCVYIKLGKEEHKDKSGSFIKNFVLQ